MVNAFCNLPKRLPNGIFATSHTNAFSQIGLRSRRRHTISIVVLSCVFYCLLYFDITRIIQSVFCLFQLFVKYKSDRRWCSSNFRLTVAKGSSVHFRHIFVELTRDEDAKMPLERRLMQLERRLWIKSNKLLSPSLFFYFSSIFSIFPQKYKNTSIPQSPLCKMLSG
jgi:hypothetical protein